MKKITIEKFTDPLGDYWLIKDENGKEIMSYLREVSQTKEDRSGGYTYEELMEKRKTHEDWQLTQQA